jgi:hypothetical protein
MAVAGSGQAAVIGRAFATPLSARVTDSFGNPLAGVSVIFAAPSSGPGGSFTGSAVVTTDPAGLATAPPLLANQTLGGFSVTASLDALSAAFALTNVLPSGQPSRAQLSAKVARGLATLTAAVSGAFTTPTGRVLFYEVLHGKRKLLGAAVLRGGRATLRAALPAGRDPLLAVYGGDGVYAGSQAALTVTVPPVA